ncbi:hypothetical protein FHS18_005980 [Paenibacillus phyllosphaerae]|uniref:Uncharacterized protein n=1 Tax=Paenibacillus phyllosphaerae TaxID=274593 RepID=A0A7W5B3Q6_9BACL|nr:hypothetical protein [Paenibacillus phyllosphaerae]MBB3113865.1 hypothetical protein [Paenibacillus phyllosphaerae]
MTGMHPYHFEKMHQHQQAELQRQHRNTWMLSDQIPKHPVLSRVTSRIAELFRGKSEKALKRKAYLVLEEMLQHENEELRLRAAEIILRRPSNKLSPRPLSRS